MSFDGSPRGSSGSQNRGVRQLDVDPPDARGGGEHDPISRSGELAGRRDQLVGLAASARRAGRRTVVSGRWLADTVVDLAPHVPVRDLATLSAHHDGLAGDRLARALVRSAGRVSGGIAATTGGVIAAQQVSVAGLMVVPFELAAETALVVATELKLITELHNVARRELPTAPQPRAGTALLVWMSGCAAPPELVGPDARAVPPRGRSTLGPAGHRQLRELLRRRFVRNLSTLAPLLTGAAAAGWLNRKATLDVGTRVAEDLGLRVGSPLVRTLAPRR